jgi:putative tryptophan/tyrosine transport system substrate-binding protein
MRRREFIALIGTAAAARPLAAHAQQQAMPVVGILSPATSEADANRMNAIRRGLKDAGYIEGENVMIEYRSAENQLERLPALAGDLVSRQVNAIATIGTPAAQAAKSATSTIPIVFSVGLDPVQLGLVSSLSRPGGNVTGVFTSELTITGKRLELLHELVPSAGVIAFLVNPQNASVAEFETETLRTAGRSLGVELRILNASNSNEIDAAFTTLEKDHSVSLVVSADALFTNQRVQLIVLAARHVIPAIYAYRELAAAGGLVSYGINLADLYQRAGAYAGRILKGAKSTDLPVQQAVKLELVINLRTAKAFGISVPPQMLARADEVIE